MNTTLQQQFDGNMNAINTYFFISVLLISSIVIADQKIPLDLDLHLDSGSTKNILAREDWREPKAKDNNWREKPAVAGPNNWNSTSVYQNDNQLAPILSDDIKPSGVLDSREAAPALKLRF